MTTMMPVGRLAAASGRTLLTLVAALGVAACRSDSEDSTDLSAAEAVRTTIDIREGLTSDLWQAEADLAQLEDSIYLYLGPTHATSVRRASERWEEYRQIECDALRLAFATGTIGPVAQLTCLVALTDGRREFLGQQYDFARPAARAGDATNRR